LFGYAHARMDYKSIDSFIFKVMNLPDNFLFPQVAVPEPERKGRVLLGRIQKILAQLTQH
jgi:hypothetical protein